MFFERNGLVDTGMDEMPVLSNDERRPVPPSRPDGLNGMGAAIRKAIVSSPPFVSP